MTQRLAHSDTGLRRRDRQHAQGAARRPAQELDGWSTPALPGRADSAISSRGHLPADDRATKDSDHTNGRHGGSTLPRSRSAAGPAVAPARRTPGGSSSPARWYRRSLPTMPAGPASQQAVARAAREESLELRLDRIRNCRPKVVSRGRATIGSAGSSTRSDPATGVPKRGDKEAEREDGEQEPIGHLRTQTRDVVLADAGDEATADSLI